VFPQQPAPDQIGQRSCSQRRFGILMRGRKSETDVRAPPRPESARTRIGFLGEPVLASIRRWNGQVVGGSP
jgi:hypothetical protein